MNVLKVRFTYWGSFSVQSQHLRFPGSLLSSFTALTSRSSFFLSIVPRSYLPACLPSCVVVMPW